MVVMVSMSLIGTVRVLRFCENWNGGIVLLELVGSLRLDSEYISFLTGISEDQSGHHVGKPSSFLV